MKILFKIICVAKLLLRFQQTQAQDNFDISLSTDETNVVYVGLTNKIQCNVNHIPSEQLFVKFTDNDENELDSNGFAISRTSANEYTLHIIRRMHNELTAHIYRKYKDSAIFMGSKKFKIRSVPRPTIELSWMPFEKQWDYLMNRPELTATLYGFTRKDIQYKIISYDFMLVSRDGPYKVSVTGNSLQPVNSLIKRRDPNNKDSVFYMFSNIKASGPSGIVYLENIGRWMSNGNAAKHSLENFYAKKMEQAFDFSKAIPNKLLEISLKIHNAALSGKIQPYHDATLKNKTTRDTYAMMGSLLNISQIPANANENSIDDFIDTAYMVPLDESRMASDLGCSFKVTPLKHGSSQRDILSVAPMYFERLFNGLDYNIPTGWFSYKAIKSLLSNDDIKFIEAYIWHLQALAEQNRSNIYPAKLETLSKNKILTYTQPNTADYLGSALLDYWRNQLFADFQQNKFSLLVDFNKSISELEFRKLHTIKINTLTQDTTYPDDPEKLIEVFYYDIPSAFDSIYFTDINNESYLKIHQKTEEPGIELQYKVPLTGIKPLIDSKAYTMLEILLNDYREKMQKLKIN
ncbi:MAG: hypothetical protein EBV15_05940 [Bacteroidetes bacterium]|nr:hypothetical protein [Bacteroidota bacterium]